MMNDASKAIIKMDNELSNRFIELDPLGYFLIKLDRSSNEIVVELYGNGIDEQGRAIDEDSGELLSCKADRQRSPKKVFIGKSAKEIGIKLTEGNNPLPLSKLDHALYMGRELQRAERCLIDEIDYIQD